jgi:hypothetical protein
MTGSWVGWFASTCLPAVGGYGLRRVRNLQVVGTAVLCGALMPSLAWLIAFLATSATR